MATTGHEHDPFSHFWSTRFCGVFGRFWHLKEGLLLQMTNTIYVLPHSICNQPAAPSKGQKQLEIDFGVGWCFPWILLAVDFSCQILWIDFPYAVGLLNDGKPLFETKLSLWIHMPSKSPPLCDSHSMKHVVFVWLHFIPNRKKHASIELISYFYTWLIMSRLVYFEAKLCAPLKPTEINRHVRHPTTQLTSGNKRFSSPTKSV